MSGRVSHWWDGVKQALSAMIEFGSDASHVQFGMAIMIAILLVTRGRRPVLAWSALAIIELTNETIDMLGTSSEAGVVASLHDIVLTLLAPTVLVIVLRSTRGRRA